MARSILSQLVRPLRLFSESVRAAVDALRTNKLRTVLSLVGISIGITAIIGVFTITDSWESKIRGSLSNYGNNVIFVQKWPWEFSTDFPWWRYYQRPETNLREYREMVKRAQGSPAIAEVGFEASGTASTLKTPTTTMTSGARLQAGTYNLPKMQDIQIGTGRYFTPREAESSSPVAVIGSEVITQLFPNSSDPLGKQFMWKGRTLTVIGTFRKTGNNGFGSQWDNTVSVPLPLIYSVLDPEEQDMQLTLMIAGVPKVSVVETKAETRGLLRAIRRQRPTDEDNFSLNQISMFTSILDGLFAIISLIGWVIGGFSILVGGFGIANIMFVSVKERTSQIGIQKALGARSGFILTSFLTESVALAVLGGAAGLFIVFLGTVLANAIGDMGIFLSIDNILLGLFTSAIIGIISGLVPAIGASRMNPVDAIRYA